MCMKCDWEDFLDEIDDVEDLMSSTDQDWPEDTVSGIKETVEEMQHCTNPQRTAIENIMTALERRR